MNTDICFTKNGLRYSITENAYDLNASHVKLPSGEYYRIESWLESMPPQVILSNKPETIDLDDVIAYAKTIN